MSVMLRKIGVSLVVLAGLLWSGPAAADINDFFTLRFAGSGPLLRFFMPKMGQFFFEDTEIRVVAAKLETEQALKALLAGEVELVGLDRPLTEAEKAQGLTARLLGWDALIVAVHHDNPLDSISLEVLREIMTGNLSQWKDCGGGDLPIVVVTCPRGSRVRGIVRELLLDGQPLLPRAVVAAIVDQADAHVAMFPGGIAVLGAGMLDDPKAKALQIDGALPEATALANGRYPLAKPLFLVTRGSPRDELKVFVDLAAGSAGQEILAEHFVPLLQK